MLLWALRLNRGVENSSATEFAAKEQMKKWMLGKIFKRKSQNYSTFKKEIYCCSSCLAILFSDLPLYLTSFSVEWMKTSLFQFSLFLSWFIPVAATWVSEDSSQKNLSALGCVLQHAPSKPSCDSIFCNVHTISDTI